MSGWWCIVLTSDIPLLVYSRSKGRDVVVGCITTGDDGYPMLYKPKVVFRRHHVRIPSGWAIAEDHIKIAEMYEVRTIRLATDDGYFWDTTLETWQAHCRVIERAGYEKQQLLVDRFWTRHMPGQPPPSRPVSDGGHTRARPRPHQQTLF